MKLEIFAAPAVVMLQADTGKYLSRINRGDIDPIEAAKDTPDIFCQFAVTQLDNGKILLQADTGKYLSRINRGDIDPIEAAKETPDVFCQYTVTQLDNGKILLQADNGKYLTRINRGNIDTVEAAKATPDVFCQFTVNVKLSLQADNGKYLSRIHRAPIDAVEAAKLFPDVFSHFTMAHVDNGKILLQADNGKYLSRINRGDTDPIEAAKETPDIFCQFTVTQLDNGKILLQADNGKYLSRINRGDTDPIEAAKDTPDAFCEFAISLVGSKGLSQEELVQAIQAYGPIVHLHPKEVYKMCSVEAFLQRATLHDKQTGTNIVHPKIEELPTGTTNDGRYWLILDDSFKGGDLSTARAYVHAYWKPGMSYTDLQFWLFYAYNGPGTGYVETPANSGDFNLAPLGEHYGDWECCMLRIDNASKTLIGVWLSQHSGGQMSGAEDLSRFQRTQQQINVYASRNGHAVYAQTGDNPSEYLENPTVNIKFYLKNRTDYSGQSLDCAKKYRIISADWLGSVYPEPQWVNYPYRWGPVGATTRMTPQTVLDIMLAAFGWLTFFAAPLLPVASLILYASVKDDLNGPQGPKTKSSWTAGY